MKTRVNVWGTANADPWYDLDRDAPGNAEEWKREMERRYEQEQARLEWYEFTNEGRV